MENSQSGDLGSGSLSEKDNRRSVRSSSPETTCHDMPIPTQGPKSQNRSNNKSKLRNSIRNFYYHKFQDSNASRMNEKANKEADLHAFDTKTKGRIPVPVRSNSEDQGHSYEENNNSKEVSQLASGPQKHYSDRAEWKQSLYEKSGWHLFAICYLVGVQSSLTTGFVNSCYSTLEKLFNFNSKFTGLIEGSFHVAIVLLVIPVSFYGRKGNKPLIMALGAALIAVGAFCYSSAEFFRDRPFSVLNVTTAKKTSFQQDPNVGCVSNGDSNGVSGESPWVKWLFVTGMFLIGVGSTPIQTVAIAYLDQGSKQEGNTGWSLG